MGTEQVLNFLQAGSLSCSGIEGILRCNLIHDAANVFRTSASGGAQHGFGSRDRFFHQLLYLGVDSPVGVNAEALRDLRDGAMSARGCLRSLPQQSWIGLRRAGYGGDDRLQLRQCAHVRLIPRPDKLFRRGILCQGLYRIEDVANRLGLYGGVFLRHPEESQKGRIVGNQARELRGRIFQTLVSDDMRGSQESSPLRGIVTVVALRELRSQRVERHAQRGLGTQYPFFSAELFGALDRFLHRLKPALGESGGNFVSVNHGLCRSGKLTVEVDGGPSTSSIVEHRLVDRLDATELLQICSASLYRSGIVLGRVGVRCDQFGRVERKLLADHVLRCWIGCAAERAGAIEQCGDKSGPIGLLVMRGGDQIALQRCIHLLKVVAAARHRRLA